MRIHHKMQTMFCFWGESLQWRFPSRHLHESLHIDVVVFVFRFLFCIFIQCPFLYDFDVVSKNKVYKLFTKFLMINPCVIENYIVNVTYVVNNNRLGYFVSEKWTGKITTEFYCRTTLTRGGTVCKLLRCLGHPEWKCFTVRTWHRWFCVSIQREKRIILIFYCLKL